MREKCTKKNQAGQKSQQEDSNHKKYEKNDRHANDQKIDNGKNVLNKHFKRLRDLQITERLRNCGMLLD